MPNSPSQEAVLSWFFRAFAVWLLLAGVPFAQQPGPPPCPSPNPNAVAGVPGSPFYDGCPLSAGALNRLPVVLGTPQPGHTVTWGSHPGSVYVLQDGGGTATNVQAYGAKGDGLTDDTSAVQAAFSSLHGGGGVVLFPHGSYKLSSQISYTLTKNDILYVVGSGATLKWSAANGGLLLVINSPENTRISCYTSGLHVIGLNMQTTEAGGGAALTVQALTSCSNPAASGFSSVEDVVVSGDDMNTHYWSAGIVDKKVSNINFAGVFIFGSFGAHVDDGIVVLGDPANSQYAVVINVSGSFLTALRNGIIYGSFVQGMTVNQTNIDELTNGCAIGIPPNAVGVNQLTITNNQFGYVNYPTAGNICLESPSINVMISTNLINLYNRTYGVHIGADTAGILINNNQFVTQDTNTPVAIYDNSSSSDVIQAHGNIFSGTSYAVDIANTTTAIHFGPNNSVNSGQVATGTGASTRLLVTNTFAPSAQHPGVTCSGSPTANFAVIGGIVTSC
jgi:hypothetical protein